MNHDTQHTLLLVSLIVVGLAVSFIVFKSPLEDYIPVLRTLGNPTQESKEQNNTEREKEISDELPEEFVVTELIRIPWGEGEGEVGLFDPYSEGRVGDFGPLMAPDSFDIDENGNVYVLDTVNGRVLKFSTEGAYLSTVNVPNVTPDDLRVRNGKMYVYDRGAERIWEYTLEGKNIATHSVPFISSFHGLYFSYADEPLIGVSDDGYYFFLLLGQSDSAQIFPQGIPSQNDNVSLSGFNIGQGELKILDRHGNLIREVRLQFPTTASIEKARHRLLGADEHGNIFVNYARRKEDNSEWSSEIWKFSEDGALLSRISVNQSIPSFETIDFSPFVDFRLTKAGELYMPFFTKESVRIFKFTSIKH